MKNESDCTFPSLNSRKLFQLCVNINHYHTVSQSDLKTHIFYLRNLKNNSNCQLPLPSHTFIHEYTICLY